MLLRKKVDLARHYDVSPTTVSKWCNRPEFPGGPAGPWDTSLVDGYLAGTKSAAGGSANASAAGDSDAGVLAKSCAISKAKKLQEEARKLTLHNDRTSGKLIPREIVLTSANELASWIADQLMAIPEELAPSFPAAQRAELTADVENKVRVMLTRMSRWDFGTESAA